MRCGSLFTGIRGLDMAVEWAGHETVWMCEKDAHARKVLETRYPDVPLYGDVTELDFCEVEPIDLLIGGGFPCQPFSSAGKRKGGDDERFLWPEVARAVRTLRPRVVVLENVADILRFGREYGLVLSDLAEAGYVCRWACLRASDVGAPHGRNRWFAVAHSQDAGLQARGGDGVRDDGARSIVGPASPSDDAAPQNPSSLKGSGLHGERQVASDAASERGNGGGPTRYGRNGFEDIGSTAPDASLSRRRACQQEIHEGQSDIDWGGYEPAIKKWERVLMRSAPAPLVEGKLSPHFVTWMMGLPENHVFPLLSRSQALKCLGNAVVPQQGFYALTQLGLPLKENEKGLAS